MEMFNDDSMFPDLEFVIPGLASPLLLHRGIMARSSRLMQGLLKAKRSAQSADAGQIQWMYDTSKDVDRAALVKVLRFCYGETLNLSAEGGELCAVVAALCRLQVICLEETLKRLTAFAVEQAEKDLTVGIQLLKETQSYQECCSESTCEMEIALAKVVLTRANICNRFESVVDGCLMKLPQKFLDIAEYGEPHTSYSEFSIRTRFVRFTDELGRNEKEEIMKKCDWGKLNLNEVRELRSLGIVSQDVIMGVYDRVLETTEKKVDKSMGTTMDEGECFVLVTRDGNG